MSFPISRAFQDDGPRMIWDSQHSCWMEPNVNEQERATGFIPTPLISLAYQRPLEGVSLFKSWT